MAVQCEIHFFPLLISNRKINKLVNCRIVELKKFTIACKWKISFQKCGDTINHPAIYHLFFLWINSMMELNFKWFSFIFNRIFTMVSNYYSSSKILANFWHHFYVLMDNQVHFSQISILFHIDKLRNFHFNMKNTS